MERKRLVSGVKTLRGQTLTANNITLCQSTEGDSDTNSDDDVYADHPHNDGKIRGLGGRDNDANGGDGNGHHP